MKKYLRRRSRPEHGGNTTICLNHRMMRTAINEEEGDDTTCKICKVTKIKLRGKCGD